MKTFSVKLRYQDRKIGSEGRTIKVDATSLAGAISKGTRDFSPASIAKPSSTPPRMVRAPEQHIFAHYHRRRTGQRGGTTFRCLKELELCQIAE